MYPEYPNLYQRARKATYFSQEEAAELLGLSAESMKQYESGRRTPSDDTVHRMAELYNLPWLELEHAKATDRLGVLPDVHIQPLPTASITLANRFRRASDQIYTLLEIAEDGDGAKKERPETGISKRSVSQRLNSENDCKNSISHSRGNASPVLSRGVYAR